MFLALQRLDRPRPLGLSDLLATLCDLSSDHLCERHVDKENFCLAMFGPSLGQRSPLDCLLLSLQGANDRRRVLCGL